MKKKSFILFCFFCFTSLTAQTTKSFLVGSETGFFGVYDKDLVNDTKYRFSLLTLDPYIGYFVTNQIAIGFTGELDTQWETGKETKTYHGIGVFAKTIFPILPNSKYGIYRRLNFAGGISYLNGNYYREDTIYLSAENQKLLKLSAGFSIRLWKRWYFEMAYNPHFFIDKGFQTEGQMNIEYHFQKKAKK